MKIVRDGKIIELTHEEMYEAYRTQQLSIYRANLKLAVLAAKKRRKIPKRVEYLIDIEEMIDDYDDEMDDCHWFDVAYKVVIDNVKSLIEEVDSGERIA